MLPNKLVSMQGTHSAFGAFLDPVADKLMVSTVLILLSSKPIVSGNLAGNSWLMPTLASGDFKPPTWAQKVGLILVK